MRLPSTLLGLLLLATGGACQTIVRQEIWLNSEAEISFSSAVRAWEIVEAGQVIGSVVEYEENAEGRRFYSVRNARQQELGLVDVHGRAWRYRAHVEEPEWLGTGTVAHGAREILQLDLSPVLYEVSLELLSIASADE